MFNIQNYPVAQETENYAEDVITVLATNKFGQPAGDDIPTLTSSDRFKLQSAVSAVQVTAASWKSNIPRGVSAHYS